MMQLYVIKDRVSGVQSPIFQARDNDAAKREMRMACRDNPVSLDLDLYHIGHYDVDNMETVSNRPIVIYNGADAEFDAKTLESIKRVPPGHAKLSDQENP